MWELLRLYQKTDNQVRVAKHQQLVVALSAVKATEGNNTFKSSFIQLVSY